jgi:hypothetical protein
LAVRQKTVCTERCFPRLLLTVIPQICNGYLLTRRPWRVWHPCPEVDIFMPQRVSPLSTSSTELPSVQVSYPINHHKLVIDRLLDLSWASPNSFPFAGGERLNMAFLQHTRLSPQSISSSENPFVEVCYPIYPQIVVLVSIYGHRPIPSHSRALSVQKWPSRPIRNFHR